MDGDECTGSGMGHRRILPRDRDRLRALQRAIGAEFGELSFRQCGMDGREQQACGHLTRSRGAGDAADDRDPLEFLVCRSRHPERYAPGVGKTVGEFQMLRRQLRTAEEDFRGAIARRAGVWRICGCGPDICAHRFPFLAGTHGRSKLPHVMERAAFGGFLITGYSS